MIDAMTNSEVVPNLMQLTHLIERMSQWNGAQADGHLSNNPRVTTQMFSVMQLANN